MIVKLNNVRLAFPSLWTPTDYKGDGKFRYRGTFLMPPAHKNVPDVNAAMEHVAAEAWKGQAAAVLAAIRADRRSSCFFDGNLKPNLAGFPGNWVLTALNEERPLVVDGRKAPLLPSDGKPYAGCYVNASVDIWAQNNGHGKAIRCQLRTVQFLRDGDSFGGGTPISEDELDTITDGIDADDVA